MSSNSPREKIVKSEAEWRAELTPEQYHITRQSGTERPFTGPYWDEKRPGLYRCISCGAPVNQFGGGDVYNSGADRGQNYLVPGWSRCIECAS